MKRTLHWVLVAILLFHLGLTILSFYTFYIDSQESTRFQFYPLALLLYSIVWLGIVMKRKMFVYAYFSLCFMELGFRVIPYAAQWKDVFGDVLFPANLLFMGLVVLTWNLIFSEHEK